MNHENSLMTIEAVSRQLRIPKHTLRFWEKEFEGILIPSRTSGGQRRYTLENIVMIGEINRLRRNGMGLAEIKRRLIASDQGTRTGSDRIDLLASRVAEVVKAEVSQFFRKENPESVDLRLRKGRGNFDAEKFCHYGGCGLHRSASYESDPGHRKQAGRGR